MTIKEVEQRLEIPRATIRFYEKEGLLSPVRGENGYREYSEEDVVLLKKIIIFRKLGFAVADIEDVLDGAKPMSEALKSNIENLTRQMQELQGAMALCRKMQENGEQIETFDAEKYWNAVEEEEKKGNRFLDIAKDVVRFEKGIVLEIFGLVDFDGKPRDKWSMMFGCGGFIFGLLFAWGMLRWLPLSLSCKFVLQRTVLGIL
ncbi:MAG: MerR family transcriptional regulator, partial [Lachnospiraceae bacterium]|nr:MerR family transcriptional regulator [Lachnospiraceae bacterium]